MANVIIASLGLREQGRIQYVMDKRMGDYLILIHSEENRTDALEIRDAIKSRGNFGVDLSQVNPWDYHEILRSTLNAVYEHHEDNIGFNPSLGTRVMSAALFFAAGFLGSVVYLVKEEKERATEVIDLYPIHRKTLTKPKNSLLSSLVDAGDKGYPSIIELANSVGMSRSSGTDHITMLERWGYVTTAGSFSKQVHITPLGMTVLKLAERWKLEPGKGR